MRAFIGIKRLPVGHGLFPGGTLGRVRAALAIVERGFIRCHDAGARAAFDGHVAHGHAAFHRHVADHLATIFDHIAGAAGGAGGADDGQRHVLGGHTGAQFAGDLDLHVLRFLLDQRLCRQDVFDLGSADAMRQRAERAMGGGVAVAADHGHAGQRPALFGTDDMHDPLTHIGHRIIVHAKIPGVLVQRRDLDSAVLGHLCRVLAAHCGGHVVVGNGDGLVGRAHRAPGHAQPLKGLRAGHFVHQVAVDIQKAGAVVDLVGHMGIPDLVIERLGGHWSSPSLCIG